jgi:hypothetical protein
VTGRVLRALATCGLWTYPLVLHAYPPAFRHEFGDPMSQAFRDLTRDACDRSGLIGLLRLWAVTLIDTAKSLVTSYTCDPSRMSVAALLGSAVYVALLAATIAYGAIRFPQFYEPPSFTRFNVTASHDENVLLAGYTRALDGELGRYRTYVRSANVVLALWLGALAGCFGIAQRSLWHGAALFTIGVAFTAGMLALMPTIWFPLDRYPVGFVWMLVAPLGAATWIAVGALGRLHLWRAHPVA